MVPLFLRQLLIFLFSFFLSGAVGYAQSVSADTVSRPEIAIEQTTPAAAATLTAAKSAQTQTQTQIQTSTSTSTATTPQAGHDLSPLALFKAAQPPVQLIVLILLACSVLTWTIFLVKSIQFHQALRHVRKEQRALKPLPSLAECRRVIRQWHQRHVAVRLLQEIDDEVHLSCHFIDSDLKGRIEYRLERKMAELVQGLRFGIAPLATIGSVTPFVGLLGTVWGIMHSFIGIANAKTVSLAVVAPGIAEALFATAVGLLAAIPAVILYNLFLRRLGVYQHLVGNVAALLFLQVRRGVCVNHSVLDKEEGVGVSALAES